MQIASPHDVFRYEPRQIQAKPVAAVNGFRIKVYVIEHPESKGGSDWNAVAVRHLRAVLKAPARPAEHPAGFAVLHAARDGVYLLIGRWYAGNNLISRTFRLDRSGKLRRMSLFACVWEMKVYGFERDAWVATTMASRRGSLGIPDYLECRLEGWV